MYNYTCNINIRLHANTCYGWVNDCVWRGKPGGMERVGNECVCVCCDTIILCTILMDVVFLCFFHFLNHTNIPLIRQFACEAGWCAIECRIMTDALSFIL